MNNKAKNRNQVKIYFIRNHKHVKVDYKILRLKMPKIQILLNKS